MLGFLYLNEKAKILADSWIMVLDLWYILGIRIRRFLKIWGRYKDIHAEHNLCEVPGSELCLAFLKFDRPQ